MAKHCKAWYGYLRDVVLVVTALALFMANLELLNPLYEGYITTYWPVGLLIYAVAALPCNHKC